MNTSFTQRKFYRHYCEPSETPFYIISQGYDVEWLDILMDMIQRQGTKSVKKYLL